MLFIAIVALLASASSLPIQNAPVHGKAELASLVAVQRAVLPPIELSLDVEERCPEVQDYVVRWEERIAFGEGRFRVESRFLPGGADGRTREKRTIGAFDGDRFMSVASRWGSVSANDASVSATGMAGSNFWVGMRWPVPSLVGGTSTAEDLLYLLSLARSTVRAESELVDGVRCVVLDVWFEGAVGVGRPETTFWLDPAPNAIIVKSESRNDAGKLFSYRLLDVATFGDASVPTSFELRLPSAPGQTDPGTARGVLTRRYEVRAGPVVIEPTAITIDGPVGAMMKDLDSGETWTVAAESGEPSGPANSAERIAASTPSR
jgi:hypothetical protein